MLRKGAFNNCVKGRIKNRLCGLHVSAKLNAVLQCRLPLICDLSRRIGARQVRERAIPGLANRGRF